MTEVREPVVSAAAFRGRESGAFDHAWAVLEQVAGDPGLTAAELVDNLGMPRATVYRIVKHLVERGYLERSSDRVGFCLGPRATSFVSLARPPRS